MPPGRPVHPDADGSTGEVFLAIYLHESLFRRHAIVPLVWSFMITNEIAISLHRCYCFLPYIHYYVAC